MTRKSLVLLFCIIVGTATLAPADEPTAVFELDGNAVVDGTACTGPHTPTGCKDDWDLLNGDGAGGSAGGSIVREFISGPADPNIFTGGRTKDPIDLDLWKWKSADTVPDKDAITNGYAAAYTGHSGHLIITFGADRFAQNGDSNIGTWFFQDNVHKVSGGTFSGHHQNNDIFVVSAFTQGGGISTITVYAWDDSCSKGVKNPGLGDCADSNLKLIYDSVLQGSCEGNTYACAEVNSGDINVSWPYLSKFGSSTMVIPEGGFFEAGIDLTDIFSLLLGEQPQDISLPCFTSWLIETRSSQEPSAVLKDFVSGAFPLCGLNTTKTCAGDGSINEGGQSIHYAFNGTVTNSGFGGLNVAIVDSLPDSAENVDFYVGTEALPPTAPGSATTAATIVTCPTDAPLDAVCADLGTLDGQYKVNWRVEFDAASVSVDNSAYAAGSSGSSLVVNSDPDGDTCSASPSNSITVTKNCGIPAGYPGNSSGVDLPGTQLVTSGGVAAVLVNFSGQVCNTGDSPLTGYVVTDDPSATISPATMPDLAAAGETGDCAKYSGYYMPSGVTLGDLGDAAGRYGFDDEIKVTGAKATLGDDPGADAICTSAFTSGAQACAGTTCHICPGDATCNGN